MKLFFYTITISLLLLVLPQSKAAVKNSITVAQDGSGDFKTITEALEAIPSGDYRMFVINVMDGVYNEKIRIEKDSIFLIGESKENTIIEFNQAQKEWNQNKDYTGPAVINIDADDVMIKNMTLHNTMEDLGPTAYVVYGKGTRTILENCKILNNGANTVTFTNYKLGMYYIKDCYIEGTVDFLKTMGWCYVEDCHLYQKEAISSIWHASINNPKQKMVVKNCYFDGVENFFIGRHHYDAQFFIIDCKFNKNLADKALYRKTYNNKPEKNKPYIYGDRHYYSGCQTEGKRYSWLDDNLKNYSKQLRNNKITAKWSFDDKWDPENKQLN